MMAFGEEYLRSTFFTAMLRKANAHLVVIAD